MAEVRPAPAAWAQQQFSQVALGDVRRTRRAVSLATQMASQPQVSWPKQAGTWAATKAGYRLFGQQDVTFEALQTQHWAQTRAAAAARAVVLHIQDGSQVDYSGPRARAGLGPIGDGGGWGFLLHTTLTVDPQTTGVLGLSHQMLAVRQPAPPQETKRQRKQRPRESEVWGQSVAALGVAPAGSCWVQVCDREADTFAFFAACQQHGHHFLVRAAQKRRAAWGPTAPAPRGGLLDLARTLPAGAQKELELRRRPQRAPRRGTLNVAWAPLTLWPPQDERVGQEPLRLWVVRVWEPQTPAGEEPIEWVLLTDVPTPDAAAARARAEWYALRWLIEEYHKCLKSGCGVEARQLETAERLAACLALLAVVAVRLLQLKHTARHAPQRPAAECVSADHVRVLAAYRGRAAETFTAYEFWREVAKLGGFLARRRDGEPGWQTVWRDWRDLDLMTCGARLARVDAPRCG
jgi:hypothetical protein